MAERRMFTQKIVDSDAFLDMPLSTQALYFHLNMRADDDGFVNNPKRIQRTIGASEDDLKLLIAKRFVIGFENGVIVIKHWRMHNTLRKDRYNPTQYQDELALLEIKDNNAYTEKLPEADIPMIPAPVEHTKETPATIWQPNGNQTATQYSIGKESIGKESKRENTRTLFERLVSDYNLSDSIKAKMAEWIKYKVERKEPYKEQGMKTLLRQIENNYQQYGDQAICNLIDDSMANGWKGIIFDRLKSVKSRPQQSYQKQTKAAELDDAYRMMAAWSEGD